MLDRQNRWLGWGGREWILGAIFVHIWWSQHNVPQIKARALTMTATRRVNSEYTNWPRPAEGHNPRHNLITYVYLDKKCHCPVNIYSLHISLAMRFMSLRLGVSQQATVTGDRVRWVQKRAAVDFTFSISILNHLENASTVAYKNASQVLLFAVLSD